MIRHIVLFKLNDNYAESGHKEILQEIERRAAQLPELIAEIRTYQFAVDVLNDERSFDFAMIMDFNSLDELKTYANHPVHQEFVEFIKLHRKERRSLDFEF